MLSEGFDQSINDTHKFHFLANDHVSQVLGYSVVGVWIIALLPQILLNFRRQSASGLAPLLLLCWLCGDTAGLAGCILTKQLTFQIVNATWHLFCDLVLAGQWLLFRSLDEKRIKIEDKREAEVLVEESYLHHRRLSLDQALAYHSDQTPMHVTRERPEYQGPRAPILPPLLARSRDERPVSARRGRRTKAVAAVVGIITCFVIFVVVLKSKTPVFDKMPAQRSMSAFSLVGITSGGDMSRAPKKVQKLGLAIAWACTAFYLGSRLPQIYHNYSRSSVQGLSMSLFVLATVANICYMGSILTSTRARTADNTEWNTQYLTDALPFFMTAGGAMAFDQVIMGQWIYYRGWEQPDPRNRLEDVLARRQMLAEHRESALDTDDSETPTPQLPSTPVREREGWLPDEPSAGQQHAERHTTASSTERTPLLRSAIRNDRSKAQQASVTGEPR